MKGSSIGWTSTGADIAEMASGLSIVVGVTVWIRRQVQNWKQQRAVERERNWHGFIDLGMLDTWYVRLVEVPDSPTARVMLDVINRDGSLNEQHAYSVRQIISSDGRLSRSPTVAEYDFLQYLHKKNGYGKGISIH
jgi:hypothetical protein